MDLVYIFSSISCITTKLRYHLTFATPAVVLFTVFSRSAIIFRLVIVVTSPEVRIKHPT